MPKGFSTITQAIRSGKLPFGTSWASAAIRHGLLDVEVIGKCKLVTDEECARIRKDPPVITREMMLCKKKDLSEKETLDGVGQA